MRSAVFLLAGLVLSSCVPSGSGDGNESPAGFPAGRMIDLTHPFDSTSVYWPTADPFELRIDARGVTDAGFYYEANTMRMAEHGGTHLDAPVHFAEGQWASDDIPVERLVGPAILVDVSERALADRDYQVAQSDFETWEAAHGPIPRGSIVLLHTGYGRFWPDRASYMGTADRGTDAVARLHFPGLDPAAAAWLVNDRSIHAIGIDTPSIDYGQSSLFESHRTLFKANIPAFENVANLNQLPSMGFWVMALPIKIRGGSGGPLRIVAVVPEG